MSLFAPEAQHFPEAAYALAQPEQLGYQVIPTGEIDKSRHIYLAADVIDSPDLPDAADLLLDDAEAAEYELIQKSDITTSAVALLQYGKVLLAAADTADPNLLIVEDSQAMFGDNALIPKTELPEEYALDLYQLGKGLVTLAVATHYLPDVLPHEQTTVMAFSHPNKAGSQARSPAPLSTCGIQYHENTAIYTQVHRDTGYSRGGSGHLNGMSRHLAITTDAHEDGSTTLSFRRALIAYNMASSSDGMQIIDATTRPVTPRPPYLSDFARPILHELGSKFLISAAILE